jgi:hypothetical protein
VILLLAACSRPPADPELVSRRDALARWEEGKAKVDADDFAGARTAFAAAYGVRPDPLLRAWEAEALAGSGDLEGAVALLGQLLETSPGFAVARYNRAAWLVRLGRREEAARELERALEAKAIEPLGVLADPDFAPVLDDPLFSFLPRSLVVATVDPAPPTAFLGTEVPVVLHLVGRLTPPITLEATARGPVVLVSVREVETSQGRDVTFLVEPTGAGTVEVGPFDVRAGPTAHADAVSFAATAPGGRTADPVQIPLSVPSVLLERVPARGFAVVDGRLYVRAQDTDRVDAAPDLSVPYTWDPLDGPTEVVRVWPPGVAVERVRIVDLYGDVVEDRAVSP